MDSGIGILNRDERIGTPAMHHAGGRLATPAPCRISAMSSSYGASVANRLLSAMVLARLPLPSVYVRGGLNHSTLA